MYFIVWILKFLRVIANWTETTNNKQYIQLYPKSVESTPIGRIPSSDPSDNNELYVESSITSQVQYGPPARYALNNLI